MRMVRVLSRACIISSGGKGGQRGQRVEVGLSRVESEF